MDILKQSVASGVPMAELMQQSKVAETPEQQQEGLSNQPEGTTMVFPESSGNFNTMKMDYPIDIKKVNKQGDLVRSYENVPPGVESLPMGDDVGTVIETPANYQDGGLLEAAQEAAANKRDFSRPRATLFPELYNVDSQNYTWFEKTMASIPTHVKEKLPAWITHCKDNVCVEAVKTLAKQSGTWKGETRSNIQFHKDPSKFGYREVSEEEKVPGDIIQYFSRLNKEGRYLEGNSSAMLPLDDQTASIEPFHMGVFGGSGEGTHAPGSEDYYYSEMGTRGPFEPKDAPTEENSAYMRKFYRFDQELIDRLSNIEIE